MLLTRFTDTSFAKLKSGRTAWQSDFTTKGLRLGATAGGFKIRYLNNWDLKAQKVSQVKLAR